MKKVTIVLLFVFLCFSLFSAEYDSEEMLSSYFEVTPLEPESEEYKYWDSVKVSLVTVSKGDPVFTWFGHSAILMEYPKESVSFDYGCFSFGRGFYLNFALGRLWYKCCARYFELDKEERKSEGRTMSAVELKISPEQKKALDDFLWINASSKHNTYLYHNYYDNCATRLRDILNLLSDGEFKEWAEAQPGLTLRQQTSKILRNNCFIQWLFDLIQGPEVDAPCTVWEEMFLPSNLEKYLLEFGKLGSSKTYLMDMRSTDNRPEDYSTPQPGYLFATVFSVILVLVPLIGRHFNKTKLYNCWIFSANLVFGIIGTLMGFMMFFTLHDYCFSNENFFFVNPLLLASAFMTYSKNRKVLRFRCLIQYILVALFLLLTVLKVILPEVFSQFNYPILITFAPYLLFVAVCCKKDYNEPIK